MSYRRALLALCLLPGNPENAGLEHNVTCQPAATEVSSSLSCDIPAGVDVEGPHQGSLTFAVAQDLPAVEGGVLVEVLHKVPGGPQAEQLLILWRLRLQAPAAAITRLHAVDSSAISSA